MNPTLVSLDNGWTEKGIWHSYLPCYDLLFGDIRRDVKHFLEIGVRYGNSFKLWGDYFSDECHLYGIDISYDNLNDDLFYRIRNHHNLYLGNAYDKETVLSVFSSKTFDIIIDDGSHFLEDQIAVIDMYLPLLKNEGILVIEDVQDINHIEVLKAHVPQQYKCCIKVIDLRHVKDRNDDILFIIDKRKVKYVIDYTSYIQTNI